MMRWGAAWMLAAGTCACLAACGGQTEGELVPLRIAVEPVADEHAALGEFTTASGWSVQLTEAQLGIAALYLYESRDEGEPAAVAQLLDVLVPVARAHGAIDPLNGKPVRAEYRDPIALDLLAGGVRELGAVSAEAGASDGLTIELLGPGERAPEALRGHSAWVAGEAERDGVIVRFAGGVDLPDRGTVRRVESIDASAMIEAGQTLLLQVNPRYWLAEADFSRLAAPPAEEEPSAITPEDQVGRAWYIGTRNPAAFSVEVIEGEEP